MAEERVVVEVRVVVSVGRVGLVVEGEVVVVRLVVRAPVVVVEVAVAVREV